MIQTARNASAGGVCAARMAGIVLDTIPTTTSEGVGRCLIVPEIRKKETHR
jgi:hypothetical protein